MIFIFISKSKMKNYWNYIFFNQMVSIIKLIIVCDCVITEIIK